MRLYYSVLLIVFVLTGCGVRTPYPSDMDHLSKTLHSLNPYSPRQESDRLAKAIYRKTNELDRSYELVYPPQFHNFLVNVGLRQKGLCYHFSDALYLHLKSQNYPSFDFHLVGANIGEYWSEHNALVVVSKACRSEKRILEKGILIDAWRNSGVIYYTTPLEDTSYQWEHRSLRCEPVR